MDQLPRARYRRVKLISIVTAAVLLGTAARCWLAWEFPFTNDEGAYLYDAKLLTAGVLPGGDALTKAPVPVGLFAGSVWMTRGSLYAARAATVLISLAMLAPLTYLARVWGDEKAVVWVVWLWAVAAAVPLQILGLTEGIAAAGAVSFLAVWHAALRDGRIRRRIWLGVLAGILFGLTYASRKTGLAVLVPAAYMWWLAESERRAGLIWSTLAGVVGIALPWCWLVKRWYGWAGIVEATGFGYGQIWQRVAPGIAGQLDWGWVIKTLVVVGGSGVLLAVIGLAWAGVKIKQKRPAGVPILLWLFVLVGMYSGWPVFIVEYAGDFLAPLTLLGALGLADITGMKMRTLVATAVFGLAGANIYSAYSSPWTGMFSREGVRSAAEEIRREVELEEPILTGAVIVPYVSGHRVWGNIAHPLWYRYGFISNQAKDVFLPSRSEVQEAVRGGEVKWVLDEDLTRYAYNWNGFSLSRLVTQDWGVVAEIPNDAVFRNNTLKLYRRDVIP